MTDKLLPCPFCGGHKIENTSNSTVSGYMFCFACGAEGPPGNNAVEAWNKRIPTDDYEDERAG